MDASKTIQLQQSLIESFQNMSTNENNKIFTVERLFAFLQKYFDEYRNRGNLEDVIPIIHRCLQTNASSCDSDKKACIDVGSHLLNLLTMNLNNETDLLIVTQIIYQVFNTISRLDINLFKIEREVFRSLYRTLLGTENLKLRARILACMQLYLKTFDTSHEIIDEVWTDINKKWKMSMSIIDADLVIFIELFDFFIMSNRNIVNDPLITSSIQKFLISSDRVQRKSAYFLLKKSIQVLSLHIATTTNNWMPKVNQYVENQWNMYVTVLENLEEEQSHLVLPTLENVRKLHGSVSIQGQWLTLLYKRILQHKNALVIRWAVEYFLSTLTCNDLNADILHLLLEATNNNYLYNYENYFLPLDKIVHFLSKNSSSLYSAFGHINWKSVPLYIWLEQLHKNVTNKSISYDHLLSLAAKVRALTNYEIRQRVLELMNRHFIKELEEMPLEKYVLYVETAYNVTDTYREYEMLFSKEFSDSAQHPELFFSQRFYEILITNWFPDNFNVCKFVHFMKKIPSDSHGWLRFAATYFLIDEKENWPHLKELFNLNLSVLKCDNILDKLLEVCVWDVENKNQNLYTRLLAFHFVLLNSVNTINDKQIALIQHMPCYELLVLISNLKRNSEKSINHDVIKEIINRLHTVKDKSDQNIILVNLFAYIKKVDLVCCQTYGEKLIFQFPEFFGMSRFINILQISDTKLFFNGDFLTGEARIEAAFISYHFNEMSPRAALGWTWLDDVHDGGDEAYLHFLLKCHKEVTEKKSRYFKNSAEHRSKFRIACCVFLLYPEFPKYETLDEIWHILLNETNQPNITLIYECLLGHYENRYNVLTNYIQQMPQLTPRQQTTVGVIAGYFWLKYYEMNLEQFREALDCLLPLTMGPNFQTRLYAQLFLYRIVEKGRSQLMENDTDYCKLLEKFDGILKAAMNGKMDELLKDIRLALVDLNYSEPYDILSVITYVTDTPFDENMFHDKKIENKPYFEEIKMRFWKKCTNANEPEIKANDASFILCPNISVQRKIKPPNDIEMQADLMNYPNDGKKSEMYVVASLIDKLPNLGGIARTCEVFGIQHLVLDSKMHITKPDFKNLSMTAERTLNIMEVKQKNLLDFLMGKQLEGFAIVGAEQTNNSQNFAEFIFPKKCVLLLGHEKDGIPSCLLSLLDSVVEIPQSGNVRSLNVHVTAALFVWEYCKQHHSLPS